jgi:hypothetical protein
MESKGTKTTKLTTKIVLIDFTVRPIDAHKKMQHTPVSKNGFVVVSQVQSVNALFV